MRVETRAIVLVAALVIFVIWFVVDSFKRPK